jgi:hypothetical protein
MNVCTAFDNSIFWAWFIWESPNSKVLIYLQKLWWLKKLKITVLCSTSGSWCYQLPCSKQKWLHCPKMSLIVIPIFVHPVCHKSLEQSRQRHQKYQNLAYKILGLLSPIKKWAGILASTTLRLRLILKVSHVLVFLVDSQKDQAQNILFANTLRTIGDSLKEHNAPPFYLSVIV